MYLELLRKKREGRGRLFACYGYKSKHMNQHDNRERQPERNDRNEGGDPETLHTTDPQEHMKGPFSSTTRGTGEAFESGETKEEATKKRDEKL